MKHTTVNVGKRAFVRLKDGTTFTDRVEALTDRFVVFQLRGRVQKNAMRSMSINQNLPGVRLLRPGRG